MKTSFSTYWRELANGTRTSTADQLLILILLPFGKFYAVLQYIRVQLFKLGIKGTRRLPRPVVSIGNITVGGTGKTPVTAYIAHQLINRGYKVAVLSRGYGGSLEGQTAVVSDGATVMLNPGECGDEPYLLASTIPGLMVVIGTDRYAAGLLAMQRLSPDIFMLDDGFQHLRLHRDLNILLLDYTHPLGNGCPLPAGLLREPASAIRRANLIIMTRCPVGTTTSETVNGTPSFAASHCLTDAIPLRGGPPRPISSLQGAKVLAFAGIAQPEFFFSGLRSAGINLVSTLSFPDHVNYEDNLAEISSAMRDSGAEYAITTEKDGVKLKLLPDNIAAITYLAKLDIDMDRPSNLLDLVLNLLPKN